MSYEKKEFLRYAEARRRTTTERGWKWEVWKKYARLTKFIDFHCDFDSSGACVDARLKEKTMTPKCCCAGCASSLGYYRGVFPEKEEDFRTIMDLYSPETGFFREGKGCLIPRELRSHTCVSYMCVRLKKKTWKTNPYISHVLKILDSSCNYYEDNKAGRPIKITYFNMDNERVTMFVPTSSVIKKELLRIKRRN